MPVQMELESLYGSTKVEINAYTTSCEISPTLNKSWQIDDVSYKNKGVFTKEEMVASTAASKSLKFEDGKYEVAIFWKVRYKPAKEL